jgi:hypothetical protein
MAHRKLPCLTKLYEALAGLLVVAAYSQVDLSAR